MLITKIWCKRFLALACALACALICVLGLSVQSFAAVERYTYDECVTKYSTMKWGQGYSRSGSSLEIDVSFEGASDAAKDAWKMVMGEWLNDPDYAVIFSLGSSNFWVYANRVADFTGFTYTGNVTSQCLQFSSSGYYFYFSYVSGSWSLNIFNTNNRSNSVTSAGNLLYRSAEPFVSDSRNPKTSYILSDIDTLIINDDVRDNEPDPPPTSSSEPEEPSAPSIIPPVDPVIPEGNPEYVVYPTSIWLSFFRWVRWHIGNGVFTGFSLLAAIIGIYLILRIVKHYSRQ